MVQMLLHTPAVVSAIPDLMERSPRQQLFRIPLLLVQPYLVHNLAMVPVFLAVVRATQGSTGPWWPRR